MTHFDIKILIIFNMLLMFFDIFLLIFYLFLLFLLNKNTLA